MPTGIYTRSREHIKKIIARNKLGQSDEARRKISIAHKGKELSEEHKRKIGQGNLGRVFSEITRERISKALTGKKLSESHRKKISVSHLGVLSGNKNKKWKGDNVGYSALHGWVKRKLGMPTQCEHCGKDGLVGRQIHWANKDHSYKRNLTDWLRLCAQCHINYDLDNNL